MHRFRSYDVELGRRLRAFRDQHGLTQAEVAGVVEAGPPTTVTQWENGVRVPEGGRRQLVEALVAGRLWPELRAAVVAAPGMPPRWAQAVRWYRRASRERPRRAVEGASIEALLEDLRDTHRPDVL
ncbi:MAG: helix-turn-helix domain-containing protein, partial [Chloroflexota bacterium]